MILALQRFWAERGCMIETPLDIEVGAGTMHPATFLRVLGPEPWNVAYVQPSRRPADGRYGDNPFRLGKHYQFQVILKPSPLEVRGAAPVPPSRPAGPPPPAESPVEPFVPANDVERELFHAAE